MDKTNATKESILKQFRTEKAKNYTFISPMCEQEGFVRQMLFKDIDIKHECNPLESYSELAEKVIGQHWKAIVERKKK